MLKTEYKMDGDLPTEFLAVDEKGTIHAALRRHGESKWGLAISTVEYSAFKEYDHSGPAIEAFNRYVANTNDFLAQQEAVRKTEELLAEQKAELARRHANVLKSVDLG